MRNANENGSESESGHRDTCHDGLANRRGGRTGLLLALNDGIELLLRRHMGRERSRNFVFGLHNRRQAVEMLARCVSRGGDVAMLTTRA